jgi:alpha-galactosidase/6-phospho-beta-glucosidase family protein
LEYSVEEIAEPIAALHGEPPGRFLVNLPYRGQIPNLPQDAVVETYAQVDAGRVAPGPAAVCHSHLVEQELTVDAAIAGDRRKALQALCLDPAVFNWSMTERLLDELFRGTAAYLPQFR